MLLEMPPQSLVNHFLKDQGVVDGIVLRDAKAFVPARRAAAGDARVYNVVGHEEECLEPLHLPSQDGGVLELLFR